MKLTVIHPTSQACIDYCSKCKSPNFSNLPNNLSIYYNDQTFSFNNQKNKLSNRAFRLLCALLKFKNTPLSFSFLHEYGWPDQLVVRNNLAVTISEIRTNIRHTDLKIENIRGFGYVLITSINEVEYNEEFQCMI